MSKEIITFELAKIAKEKGFNSAPTYHQLIDWIFNKEIESLEDKILWLEFWYEYLKDCPLKGEFLWRLEDWFYLNSENSFGYIRDTLSGDREEGFKTLFQMEK